MTFALWCTVIGVLLVTMAIVGSALKRLPLSTSILYIAAGFGIGPAGLALLTPDPYADAAVIERATEVAVLISLFASGMKMKLPLSDRRWRFTMRLAIGAMIPTIALVTLAGVYGLGLPLGAAVLLGAILAPTDPVLATDVQVREPGDRDPLRFSLTSEAGLNDGAAFPFVMLGLGLLGLHDLGQNGWRWLAVDLVWAVAGGLAIGAGLGWLAGRTILFLRIRFREALGLEEFLTLGLIGLAYGVALLCHSYGFLAVFAAGYNLQRVATRLSREPTSRRKAELATSTEDKTLEEDRASHPRTGPTHMTSVVLSFTEQLERILEVALVLLVGAMLSYVSLEWRLLLLAPLLLVIIRPVSVWLALAGSRMERSQRQLIAWFGIRGIGCIYYLFYSISHGLPQAIAGQLLTATLVIVAASILIHGISVTPLMELYSKRGGEKRRGRAE